MYRKHRDFTESELKRLLKKLTLTSEIDNVAEDDHIQNMN